MRAIPSSWKEKLPSALVALGVQAAIFALLIFSFSVVTRAPEKEAEVIFLLPRLKPLPPEPMIIDARPKQPVAGAPPAATSNLPPGAIGNGITALPGYAQPPSGPALLQALGRAMACKPDPQGHVSALCPSMARPDPNAVVMNPPDHVQNPDRWAAEKARIDGPTVLPGGNPLGILITALTNPSAFLDKGSYTTPPPPKGSKTSGAEHQALGRYSNPQCPPGMGTDMERRSCGAEAGALEGMRVPLAGAP